MIRTRIKASAAIVLLSACSIQNHVPGFTFPISSTAADAPWPDLIDQRQFGAEFEAARAPQAIDGLEARVASLRARAAAEQAPILTPAERRRLLQPR